MWLIKMRYGHGRPFVYLKDSIKYILFGSYLAIYPNFPKPYVPLDMSVFVGKSSPSLSQTKGYEVSRSEAGQSHDLAQLITASIAPLYQQPNISYKIYFDLAEQYTEPVLAEKAMSMALAIKDFENGYIASSLWSKLNPRDDNALYFNFILGMHQQQSEALFQKIPNLLLNDISQSRYLIQKIYDNLSNKTEKKEFLALIEKYLTMNLPENSDLLLIIAELQTQLEQSDAALKSIQHYQQDKSNDLYASLLEISLLKNKSEMKKRYELIKLQSGFNESSPKLRLKQAEILLILGNEKNAFEVLEILKSNYQHSSNIKLSIAQLYEKLNVNAQAYQLYQELAYENPDSDYIKYKLGQLSQQTKRFGEAEQWFTSIGMGEFYFDAQIAKAKLYHQNEQGALANEVLNRLNPLTPWQTKQWLLTKISFLKDLGQLREADKLTEVALKLFTHDRELYEYFGRKF